jgi:hypothetical protein
MLLYNLDWEITHAASLFAPDVAIYPDFCATIAAARAQSAGITSLMGTT